MLDRIALYEAGETIYKEIARLRRGLPIAEAKAQSALAKLQTHKRYNAKSHKLRDRIIAQSRPLWAAFYVGILTTLLTTFLVGKLPVCSEFVQASASLVSVSPP